MQQNWCFPDFFLIFVAMKRVLHIILTLLLFANCSKSQQEAIEPALTDMAEDITYYSAKLTATFDHAERILSGGFYLESADAGPEKVAATLSSNTIFYEWTGLKPDTEYSYQVYFTNGKEERKLEKRTFRTAKAPCDEALWNWAVKHFDTDGNGNLSSEELAAVKELILGEEQIPLKTCNGLELFPNVENLYLNSPVLQTVELSGLPKLADCWIRGAKVESIVFDNPILTKFRADGTKIANLDFTGATALQNIEIYGVPFKQIHFDNNPKMDTFVLTGSKAEVIDMSICPLMYRIDFGTEVSTVPCLKKLILSKNSVFEVLKVPSSVEIEYK